MVGADFFDLWSTGRAILLGQGAYTYYNSVYPPAAALLYTLLALFPFPVMYGLWTGLNVISIIKLPKDLAPGKTNYAWFLFSPVVFTIAIGQIDLLLFWLSHPIRKGGWIAVLAATLITIKPQVAFIVLPWYLIQWLVKDRKMLIRWALCTGIFHALPLLYDVTIYQQWLGALQNQNTKRLLASTGIFTLSNLDVPFWIMAVLAGLVLIYGLMRDRLTSISTQILGLPWGIWYENVILIGLAPWWLMVPISWIAFLTAYLVKNSFPFLLIPLAAFLWRIFKNGVFPKTTLSNEI